METHVLPLSCEAMSPAQIDEVINVLKYGYCQANADSFTQEQLDALYALAYSLYEAGNYSHAQTIFSLLALLVPASTKFMMGEAACNFAKQQYAEAIAIYKKVYSADHGLNPEPLYLASMCYIELGDVEQATYILSLASKCQAIENERYDEYKDLCTKLKELIELEHKISA